MKDHQKFLEFNGKTIVYLSVEGVYWIPVKPICEALNIDADSSIKRLKLDPILGAERCEHTVQVSNNGISQGRKMTCIPEEFVYGWIFSLRSDSKELIEYKRTCYKLLFNHFHGAITQRKDLLVERKSVITRIFELKEEMKNNDEKFQELKRLEAQQKALSQVDVSGEVCKCINWHPPVARDKGRKSVCSNCNRPRHTLR